MDSTKYDTMAFGDADAAARAAYQTLKLRRENNGGKLFAVYSRVCGHVFGAPEGRRQANAVLDGIPDDQVRRQTRVRVATDADLAVLARRDRCVSCDPRLAA